MSYVTFYLGASQFNATESDKWVMSALGASHMQLPQLSAIELLIKCRSVLQPWLSIYRRLIKTGTAIERQQCTTLHNVRPQCTERTLRDTQYVYNMYRTHCATVTNSRAPYSVDNTNDAGTVLCAMSCAQLTTCSTRLYPPHWTSCALGAICASCIQCALNDPSCTVRAVQYVQHRQCTYNNNS